MAKTFGTKPELTLAQITAYNLRRMGIDLGILSVKEACLAITIGFDKQSKPHIINPFDNMSEEEATRETLETLKRIVYSIERQLAASGN